MTCATARPAPLRCPTVEESIAATVALLPSGRAWQSNALAEHPFRDAAFDPAAFDSAAFDIESAPGTILYRFWSAVGVVRNFVERRLCDLRLEFWCATHKETHEEWLRDYDLPDACDPFPDLCTKVAAIGGTRCDYYVEIAALAGWSIACIDRIATCAGPRAGSARAGSNRARAGGLTVSDLKLEIVVYLDDSAAYQAPRRPPALAGRIRAGQRPSCGPSISPLLCVLERVVHAHVPIVYQTV